MRILLTNHFPYHGSGTGTYVRDLATLLRRSGHEVCALIVDRAPRPGGEADSARGAKEIDPCATTRILCGAGCVSADLDFDFPCFTGHPYSANTFYLLSNRQLEAYLRVTTEKMAWIIEAFRPDIVHCQHIWLQASTLERLSVPYVISAQGTELVGYASDSRCHRRARDAAAGAGLIVAASDYIRRQVVSVFAGVTSRVETVLSAIDTSVYTGPQRPRAEALQILGLPAVAGPIVAFVGKLVPFKGADVLIDAAQIYGRAIKDICTVLCGDGPLRGSLEERAQRAYGGIYFLGDRQRDQRAILLQLADLVVMPSRQEPLGLVALEAMASGTPVVATRAGGLPEIVDDETGALVDEDDPEALARLVVVGISERWKATKGGAARERVWCRHASTDWVARLERIYRATITERADP